MVNTPKVIVYIDFLHQLFTLLHKKQLKELPSEFARIICDIIPQFIHMEEVCGDSHMRERILEIIFHLPLPIDHSEFVTFVKELLPFYIRGLYGPTSLQKSGVD